MILNFFFNACILITFISIAHIFLKDKDVNNNFSLTLKIIAGVSSGLLGMILMLYSVNVTSNIIIDFRYIPMLLTAIYVGFLPTIVATIGIGVFRVLYFGFSEPSIIGLITALIVGIGFSIISSFKLSRKNKWIFSIIYLFLIFSIALFMTLGVSITSFGIIVMYCIGNICVSWIIFIYAENLIKSVQLNNKFKDEATKDFLTGLNNVRYFDTSFNSISQLTLRKEEKNTTNKIDDLLEDADKALYEAKRTGRNKVVLYNNGENGIK